MSTNVKDLIQSAKDEGLISPESGNILNIPDLGAQIQNALGVSVDDVETSEVVLVTIMPDDSGSIAGAGNEQAIINGHNLVIDALKQSKQSNEVLFHTRYLNGTILNPFCFLDTAKYLDSKNYDPCLGTPLYDSTVFLLATILTKTQDFMESNSVPTRTITLIVTDGEDQHSTYHTIDNVKTIIQDMLKQENHIIAGMGVDNGSTNFKQVFEKMGILDKWILTPGNTESEIRKAFQIFSQSAVQASQGAANFSRAALGGFGV
ncbi:MAG: hypothetical protein ABIJ97_13340 [Bacteroidota bacterium]